MGIKLWNRLDANVRNAKPINIFKHIIKICLFLYMTDANADVILFTVQIQHI